MRNPTPSPKTGDAKDTPSAQLSERRFIGAICACHGGGTTKLGEHQRMGCVADAGVFVMNRGRLQRLAKLAGLVLALEMFMPGGTLIALCVLFGSHGPAWARK